VQSVLGHLVHVSDLHLFASKPGPTSKASGHRHAGSSLSRTRTLYAWHDAASLRLTEIIKDLQSRNPQWGSDDL
jgi:hypothetical protein